MTERSLPNHDRVPTLQGLSQSHWDEMGTGDMAMQAWNLKHMHFNKYMKQQTGTHVTLRETLKTITVRKKVSGRSAAQLPFTQHQHNGQQKQKKNCRWWLCTAQTKKFWGSSKMTHPYGKDVSHEKRALCPEKTCEDSRYTKDGRC